jgi:deoxyribodipyrimidine photolyase-related protein
MEGDEPLGGQWNFDAENRKPIKRGTKLPSRLRFDPDAVTKETIALVAERFPDHFGDLEPFGWAVTRADAKRALEEFMQIALPSFGDYQDAMVAGEDFLFHSLVSAYLNAGLLEPREVCEAALAELKKGTAPLNAVEGFIRQIIGWREFVRGIYWTRMPEYRETNSLAAKRPIPALYWTGETEMRCMSECIRATRMHAYAHHIQRLMVTGNFALLAGIEPKDVQEWYLAVYADAYEWVELPNVHGMVLHADGGLLGSKPYAASGAYINRMSDYCDGCAFDPDIKIGKGACPFNLLYWDFLMRNEALLKRNPRMAMPYKTLQKMPEDRRKQISTEAETFLSGLTPWR